MAAAEKHVPSISIDLPGWCTLSKATRHGEDEQVWDNDYSCPGSDRISRSNSTKSNANSSDSDHDEDDEDGAIARLFSLGQKRKRSDPHARPNRSSSGGVDGESAYRMIRSRSSRMSARVSEEAAKAYADWACTRCTYINAYDQSACNGCGGTNRKREQLLQERKETIVRRERMESAFQSRQKSMKADALKDMMEDSDSEHENIGHCHPIAAVPSIKPSASALFAGAPPGCVVQASSTGCSMDVPQRSGQAGSAKTGNAPMLIKNDKDTCSVQILPPDLLLQCTTFLDDASILCSVREVSSTWLVALDGREAAHRLWRPLFCRLRAVGAIHEATDRHGQRKQSLKVYDLGKRSGSSIASPVPSPSVPALSECRLNPNVDEVRTSAYIANPSSVESEAAPATAEGSYSVACTVCGLIQREGYNGQECEMCASSLLVQSRPSPATTTPQSAYRRVNLTDKTSAAGSAASDTKSGQEIWRVPTPKTGVATASRNESRREQRTDSEIVQGEGDGEVDWHFLLKRLTIEKRTASAWGSLHHGWVWLQGQLKNILHRCRKAQAPFTNVDSGSWLDRRSSLYAQQPDTCCATYGRKVCSGNDAGPAPVAQLTTQEADRSGELNPTILRLVQKLANRKWVVLYDSLKAMFTIQANGLAREVLFAADAAAISSAAEEASQEYGASTARPRAQEYVELRAILAGWEAFKDWCEEVDMYCESLNERISSERYRNAGAGCGRGDNTPYIRDTALLSFRHSFALNIQICAKLRAAISLGISRIEGDVVGDACPRQGMRWNAKGAFAAESKPRAPSREARSYSTTEVDDDLFTERELMEDSRAIDFSVRTLSHPRPRRGDHGSRTAGQDVSCKAGDGKHHRAGCDKSSLGRPKRGNYYDWFLNKLEGQEASMIRGEVDAWGKRLPPNLKSGAFEATAVSESGMTATADSKVHEFGEISLENLLDRVLDMVEELDVPDDNLSKDRHTQGAIRRRLLLPLKRWQAACSEAGDTDAADPQHLLMAGLSPAPGEEGKHRLRSGAAGRRKGCSPPLSLCKGNSKSWEHISAFFG